jgi:hypothetical protein
MVKSSGQRPNKTETGLPAAGNSNPTHADFETGLGRGSAARKWQQMNSTPDLHLPDGAASPNSGEPFKALIEKLRPTEITRMKSQCLKSRTRTGSSSTIGLQMNA